MLHTETRKTNMTKKKIIGKYFKTLKPAQEYLKGKKGYELIKFDNGCLVVRKSLLDNFGK